jgi:hypothetical protein
MFDLPHRSVKYFATKGFTAEVAWIEEKRAGGDVWRLSPL